MNPLRKVRFTEKHETDIVIALGIAHNDTYSRKARRAYLAAEKAFLRLMRELKTFKKRGRK